MSDREHIDWSTIYETPWEGAVRSQLDALHYLDRRARGAWADGWSSALPLSEHLAVRSLRLAFLILVSVQVLSAFVSVWFWDHDASSVPRLLLLAVALAFSGSALGLLRTAPNDRRARALALLFSTIASATSIMLLSRATAFPELATTLVVFLPEGLLPYFLWSLVELLPRVSRYGSLGPLIRVARIACFVVGVTLISLNALDRLGVAPWVSDHGSLIQAFMRAPTGLYWLTVFLLALPAPWVALLRTREAEPAERRRTVWFVLGLFMGIMPLALAVLAEMLLPSFHQFMSHSTPRRVGSLVVYGSLLTIPLSASVAVGASFFRIRPMLRRAARLALARSTLAVLSASTWLALLVLTWQNRHQTLTGLVQSPGILSLLALGTTTSLLTWWRPRLVGVFSKEVQAVRAGETLSSLARGVYAAREMGELEQLVRTHARELVGATSTWLLVRSEGSDDFLPVSKGCRSLEGSSLIGLLCQPPSRSLPVGGPKSLVRWLPEEERQWLAEGEIELVVPLAGSTGDILGLLLLQAPMDSSAYGREARRLAEALGSTVIVGLERLERRSRFVNEVEEEPARECRACGAVAESSVLRCECGESTKPCVLPHVVRGMFRVERLLGAGGMGRVYLALDLNLGRRVALKTLPRLQTRSLVRLRREARSMATFVHPHLALIFGVETWRGVPILVVEYLAGGTLGETDQEPLSPIAVMELGIKLADGLRAMHDKGLLHRDVKPSNIGFSTAGEPKLLDFGLAGLVDQAGLLRSSLTTAESAWQPSGFSLTGTNHLLGTPLYLSPEVLRGGRFSVAEDLWSLHLVLWEALAGHHPLSHLDLLAALTVLRSGQLPGIEGARPDCPPLLARLLSDGLGKPSGRPTSAEEMGRRLIAALR